MFVRSRRVERGVALIVTVIMLSVITFLAVAFLALMGREKGSVKTATDQTIARLAADTARERAQAELLATILATTNPANFDLLVSTNFINWNGFDPGAVNNLTNVNYDYQLNKSPLTGPQALANLASLYYNPRPPVFITNRLTGVTEFRFFNDLNRNGRPERTGFWPLTNEFKDLILTNGTPVTNYLVGDPEWLGGLERADLPHSPSNRFAYRYSYLVVPAGKTLDVNYIHNQTLASQRGRMNLSGADYRRNEGVGSWELNLAAFLHDLNTNGVYGWGNLANTHSGYDYNSINPLSPLLPSIGGNAFSDAGALFRFRINGNPNLVLYDTPASILDLSGGPGAAAFRRDYIDGYSDNATLLSTNGIGRPASGLTVDNDPTGQPWPGSPQPYHFFTPQDLFNPTKTDAGGGYKFSQRLAWAGTNVSTYDQYTYYRLLSQLGTDSAPEDPEKLNLNYVNIGGLSATNFVRWDDPDLRVGNSSRGIPNFGVSGAVLFFTNATHRLLQKYTAQWLADNPTNYVLTFGTNQPFGVANIPVLVSNNFAYTPALHRLLQVAANIYDANNSRFYSGAAMPTVFRPRFSVQNGNVYIVDFVEVTDANTILGRTIRDLVATNAVSALLPDDLVFGVPLVIGAKQGFPNFNEFSMQNVLEITRKLQVTRTSMDPSARPTATNMMYVIGISNEFGLEAWNSYTTNFNRQLDVYVTNTLVIGVTNTDRGLNRTWPMVATVGRQFTVTTWPGFNTNNPVASSFVIPFQTNMAVIPQSIYRLDTHAFVPSTGGFLATGSGFPQPQWGLNVSNKLQFLMVDRATRRIIDYVNLSDMKCNRDLSEEIRDPDYLKGFDGLWSTNQLRNSAVPQGVFNQIDISMGNVGGTTTDWKDYGLPQSSGSTKDYEIDYFRVFNSGAALKPLRTWSSPIVITSLVQQVPFTPTKRVSRYYTWQANDPLVHYMANDLRYLAIEDDKQNQSMLKVIPALTDRSLGKINDRYQPWGGNPQNDGDEDPNKFNLAVKDPGVKSSDFWSFPTNAFPTVGWLGRVHRGTPWQTVYLKSPEVNLGIWTNWAGTALTIYSNSVYYDAVRTLPREDRLLFDVFTTALDENSTRGQLSVNQANLAAWSAVFSGVVALTNTSSSQPFFAPLVIQPAGEYDSMNPNNWPPLAKIVAGINRTRANTNLFLQGSFQHLGDILAVPELSVGDPAFVPSPTDPRKTQGQWYWTNKSPYLEFGGPVSGTIAAVPPPTSWQQTTLTDAAVEWLPQQVMSLLRLGDPRFVIYGYGQALHPAANSVLTSGPYFQMCTNYQITAEVATRAVVRVEGSPDPRNANHPDAKKRYPPHLVVESFNYLAPD